MVRSEMWCFMRFFVVFSILGRSRILDAQVQSSRWCVARTNVSSQAVQNGLDYACGIRTVDCSPIQSTGSCFLPNTVQAHASYAYNSYFQLNGMTSSSCNFNGTATISDTNPSFGSCVYPSSASTAGGTAPFGATGAATGTATTTTSSPVPPPPPGTAMSTFVYGTTAPIPSTSSCRQAYKSKGASRLQVTKILVDISFLFVFYPLCPIFLL